MRKFDGKLASHFGLYLLGMVLLALGLTLVEYCVLVAAQFVVKGKNRTWVDLLQLVVAIILTGVGAAMTVDMQLVPNPGDCIVHSLAQRFGKELGLCKNLFDVGCVAISLVLGLAFGDPLLGIGLGTILSMMGVGRSIAVFNGLCKPRLLAMAGLQPAAA